MKRCERRYNSLWWTLDCLLNYANQQVHIGNNFDLAPSKCELIDVIICSSIDLFLDFQVILTILVGSVQMINCLKSNEAYSLSRFKRSFTEENSECCQLKSNDVNWFRTIHEWDFGSSNLINYNLLPTTRFIILKCKA